MKLKKNFSFYNIADDYLLIPTGKEISTFGGTVVLNEVSAFLLNEMKDDHRTLDQLVTAVLNEYDIDEKTARADIDEAITSLRKIGVIED